MTLGGSRSDLAAEELVRAHQWPSDVDSPQMDLFHMLGERN